jgi:hypothetical protein
MRTDLLTESGSVGWLGQIKKIPPRGCSRSRHSQATVNLNEEVLTFRKCGPDGSPPTRNVVEI